MGKLRQEFYNNAQDKKHIKDLAHELGESTIHDDFIWKDGKPTDGTVGRLTFERLPDPPKRKILTVTQLSRKLKDKRLTLEELQDLIEIQALKILPTSRWQNFRALFTG